MTELLTRAVLVAGSLVLTLAGLEVGLRLFYPDPPILAPHAHLGALPRPNLDVRKVFGGYERVVRISTNSLGLRTAELAPLKPAGVRRLLALGDSFTFGHGVDAAEAWPARLEASLNAGRYGAWEVVNAGVTGFGTGQQLLLYRMLAPSVRPDAVVLGFAVVNDVLDNLCVDPEQHRLTRNLPCFVLEGDRLVVRPPAGQDVPAPRLRRHLRIVEFATSQAMRATVWNPAVLGALGALGIKVTLPFLPETVTAWYDPRFAGRGWTLTRRLLFELHATLGSARVPFVLLVIPSSLQVDESRQRVLALLAAEHEGVRAFLQDPLRPQRLVLEFCRELGTQCVDPLPALRQAQAEGELAYFRIDGHWTPSAHRIAARLVAAQIWQGAHDP